MRLDKKRLTEIKPVGKLKSIMECAIHGAQTL